MQFNFKTSLININEDGQGTACLDFHMEVIDSEFRDLVMSKIMKILSEEHEEEAEESVSCLGFDTRSSGTESPDEG
jgi:hypothetical protein